ncbi:protein phosphatase 4, regulatory subunit 2 [Lobosporangium transversale]|uniref:PPP4R2-domain-containing protein n=1 Tax=Lobosporangium transversale TaxID=64571 RepID=A0A1Y2GMA0_9FUNG|nr:hypothetical protein BCR41DRAFT_422287 [Lobosporangium transversale]KAF9897329.1 protein phosphatase 4, regulatory subunit 2 [Lobosporangium transversale]ORZ15510.1 hypothetical protein BCR41DRAFT_422287 [Lobosporangium transversale]|eukprot:XP_021881258.1 hypothetical protein BCR41DRAFT_422287 [Lobosporangium transversale]
MVEHNETTASVDSNALIEEISLTNQISVPWEELRLILKARLVHVLESKQLIYTPPTVTNPLTTKLKPLTDDIAAPVSSAVLIPLTDQTNFQTNAENPPPTHVSEQGGKEEEQIAKGNTKDEPKEETKPSGQESPVTASAEGPVEGKTTSETSTVGQTEVSDSTNASQSTTPVVEVTAENRPPMIPISKDTLLVETPEGYHERINGLLDAFTSAPFTIQRVCELLHNPTEHHSNLIKYLRAVEKVLMITSSINEFSNPAYNGPSALDEDTEKAAGATIANGDYSKATDLNFALISETPLPTPESEDVKDSDVLPVDAVEGVAQNHQANQAINGSDEAVKEDDGMDVEKTMADVSSDMEVDAAAASTMDGIEKEVDKHDMEERKDIQPGSDVVGSMELDEA